MNSIEQIQSHVKMFEIVNISILLFSSFLVLAAPAFAVTWFFRGRSLMLRATLAAVSVVIMSVIVPVTMVFFSELSMRSTNYLPASQD
jgi:cation transporter-like permease